MSSSLPDSFKVARCYSSHGTGDLLTSCLDVTDVSDDGAIMGVQHKTLPIAAA